MTKPKQEKECKCYCHSALEPYEHKSCKDCYDLGYKKSPPQKECKGCCKNDWSCGRAISPCGCSCHQSPPQEECDWEKEFDEHFEEYHLDRGEMPCSIHRGSPCDCDVKEYKSFIKNLLQQKDHDHGILVSTLLATKNNEIKKIKKHLLNKE